MRGLLPFILIALATAFGTANAEAPPREYRVKSAYLYNLLKLTGTHSPHAEGTTLRVCLRIKPALTADFTPIEGKVIRGRTIALRLLNSDAPLSDCELLFIAADFATESRSWLERAEKGVLTVGETKDFCELGGMLELFMRDDTVQVRLNEAAVQSAELPIDPIVRRLAEAFTPKDERAKNGPADGSSPRR